MEERQDKVQDIVSVGPKGLVKLPDGAALEAAYPTAVALVGEHVKRLTQQHTGQVVSELVFDGSPNVAASTYGHGWLRLVSGTRASVRYERFYTDMIVNQRTVGLNVWAGLFLHPQRMVRQLYWCVMEDPLRRIEAMMQQEVPTQVLRKTRAEDTRTVFHSLNILATLYEAEDRQLPMAWNDEELPDLMVLEPSTGEAFHWWEMTHRVDAGGMVALFIERPPADPLLGAVVCNAEHRDHVWIREDEGEDDGIEVCDDCHCTQDECELMQRLLDPKKGLLGSVFHNQSTADPMGAAAARFSDGLVHELTGREVGHLAAGDQDEPEPEVGTIDEAVDRLSAQAIFDHADAATLRPWEGDQVEAAAPIGPRPMTPDEKRKRRAWVARETRRHFRDEGIHTFTSGQLWLVVLNSALVGAMLGAFVVALYLVSR